MANPLSTEHFPIPVRVENEELRVKVTNKVSVIQNEQYFGRETSHQSGNPHTGANEIIIGGDNNRYVIEFIAATRVGNGPYPASVNISVNGVQFQYNTDNFSQKVLFVLERNQSIRVWVGGNSHGGTTSSIYVSGRVISE